MGLTGRRLNMYKEVKKRTQISYAETFSEFCEAMCKTDLLKDEEKFIIRKLLKQWRMNKK